MTLKQPCLHHRPLAQIEMTVAILWARKIHLGHFQEFGSILFADEELCICHLCTWF